MALDVNNILSPEEAASLFLDVPEDDEEKNEQDTQPVNTEDKKDNTAEESKVIEPLFSESVGGDYGTEDAASDEDSASPIKSEIYSPLASALMEEGIFQSLNEEEISNIKSADDFAKAFESELQSRLDETQKRVSEALNMNIEVSEIQRFENTLNYLDNIKDRDITNESDAGSELRRRLIYTDFINRGYSQDRATREVNKSFKSGTDIEDAREALQSNKEYFNEAYRDLIDSAKEEQQKQADEVNKQSEALKKDMLDTASVFGDVSIDKATRKRAYDLISKPVYKNPDTGAMMTELQKYQYENRMDFVKNIGLLYAMTDGFKNVDKLVGDKVRKEKKKGFRELENTINNTSRNSSGALNFSSGVDHENTYIGNGGYTLDI